MALARRWLIRAGHADVFVFADRPFARLPVYEGARLDAGSAERGVWGACNGDFHSSGPAPESRSESAERFVRRFYLPPKQRRFSVAWTKLSPGLRWAPAVEAAGVRRPARIDDLRSTFASDALAAGVSAFELARVMGTSIEMVERHYGTLLDGATAGIAGRLDALDDERDRATDERLGH